MARPAVIAETGVRFDLPKGGAPPPARTDLKLPFIAPMIFGISKGEKPLASPVLQRLDEELLSRDAVDVSESVWR